LHRGRSPRNIIMMEHARSPLVVSTYTYRFISEMMGHSFCDPFSFSQSITTRFLLKELFEMPGPKRSHYYYLLASTPVFLAPLRVLYLYRYLYWYTYVYSYLVASNVARQLTETDAHINCMPSIAVIRVTYE
jgi:hypothetical protein